MEHTHEYDCVVCGAHFDSQDDLSRHDREKHTPTLSADPSARAEPMGTEHRRVPDPGDDAQS